ncbi:MAG: hypothetical protein NZ761_02705 [Dehalococcoidia bacterium]|nr:hypothetical protein [Dehalococcoidia bacterium]
MSQNRANLDAVTESVDALRALLGINRRGPWPGAGANGRPPSWGIVEETPQLWVTWLAGWWKRLTGKPLPARPPFTLRYKSQPIVLESVPLRYGYRWYFRCPCCHRRCEVLYVGHRGLACRFCNRLLYRSQARRIAPLIDLFDWTRDRTRSTPVPSELDPLLTELKRQVEHELTRLFSELDLIPQEVGNAATDAGPA